jgi:hypothetical protein
MLFLETASVFRLLPGSMDLAIAWGEFPISFDLVLFFPFIKSASVSGVSQNRALLSVGGGELGVSISSVSKLGFFAHGSFDDESVTEDRVCGEFSGDSTNCAFGGEMASARGDRAEYCDIRIGGDTPPVSLPAFFVLSFIFFIFPCVDSRPSLLSFNFFLNMLGSTPSLPFDFAPPLTFCMKFPHIFTSFFNSTSGISDCCLVNGMEGAF